MCDGLTCVFASTAASVILLSQDNEEPWHATAQATVTPPASAFVDPYKKPESEGSDDKGDKPKAKVTPQGKGWGTFDNPNPRSVATTHDNSR